MNIISRLEYPENPSISSRDTDKKALCPPRRVPFLLYRSQT